MNRFVFLLLVAALSFSEGDLFAIKSGISPDNQFPIQDTARNRQILFNGSLWRDTYSSIKGDPFFLSSQFLPGAIRMSGHLFTGVRLKYDICTDQVLILKDFNQSIQINKEMVNFFSLTFVNREYIFVRVTEDTLKYFTGYMNELYKGRSALYVKYIKEIEYIITGQYLGKFNDLHRMFIRRDNMVWPVKNLADLSRALNTETTVLKSFLKKNKLKVTKKDPESFIPILQYFDSLPVN